MKCVKYFDAINDLVEDELDEQTTGEVNLHVLACPECALRYELLQREKKMYAQFLFDDEPSNDLPMRFRAEIKSEADNALGISWIPARAFGWKRNIAEFLRLHPVSAGATALVVFGIGFSLLKFAPDKTMPMETEFAKTESSSIQFPTAKSTEIDKEAVMDLSPKANRGDDIASPKSVKKKDGNKFADAKRAVEKNIKSAAFMPRKIKKQLNSANENENLNAGSQMSKEEQLRITQLRNLEKETAKQVEKIELLLRSFRNARTVEGGTVFDISYEKQQAKKLLEKNAQLKLIAENYGTLYAEEILVQVERSLLEISNLEINPSPAKVLEIQERVKNQNLIASLQAYY